jgi:hypothetical protein
MKVPGGVQARRAGVHPKGRTIGPPIRPSRWRWAVPRDDLKRLLGLGLGPSEIARRYGLNHSTVSRAIRALEHQELVAVVLGNRCQPSLPQIPPPPWTLRSMSWGRSWESSTTSAQCGSG